MPARSTLARLSAALAVFAARAGHGEEADAQALTAALESARGDAAADGDYVARLNALIAALQLNVTDLARSLNFDASYLSRIRAGRRRSADPAALCAGVARYALRHSGDGTALARLLDKRGDEPLRPEELQSWLLQGSEAAPDGVTSYLRKLDEFDLNDFIRSIRFDGAPPRMATLFLPPARSYYGLSGFAQAELDFFRATVLSRAAAPVFMCSDMPMADMAADREFGKKWMLGLALMLKKGLELRIIHSLDRPFEEMMLGLESWIPVYMTGQISPYYLRAGAGGVYGHLNYVSGAAALEGECVAGSHARGRYRLSRSREDVAYMQDKAECLLKKAAPLMDIYTRDKAALFRAFLRAAREEDAPRRDILCALPLYTLSEELLGRILARGGVTGAEAAANRAHVREQRAHMEALLTRTAVHDELPLLTPEEYARYPLPLPLSGLFREEDILCSYEEYQEHLLLTQAFAARHAGYGCSLRAAHPFRNIQIRLCEGRWVLISKNKSPAIHFVIRHPRLCRALESLGTADKN